MQSGSLSCRGLSVPVLGAERQGGQQNLQILLILGKGAHSNNLVEFATAGSALRCYDFLIYSLRVNTPGVGIS